MKPFKNIAVGFIVSFVGSLPLGYLNIIGVEVFSKFGMNSLVFYLFGVISIEAVVIYFTVIFANQLVNNKKLMKSIDFFAVFFLLLLAYLFYAHSNQTADEHNYLEEYVQYSPFLIGLVLCGLNFLQIPFWVGWNLYLMNANHIALGRKLRFYYIFGTLLGTFCGMLAAIVMLASLSKFTLSFSKYIMPVFIPLFFVGLAFFQAFKVYKKYIR
jgi:threonine/homoserine/homoserine lactone efflux protein